MPASQTSVRSFAYGDVTYCGWHALKSVFDMAESVLFHLSKNDVYITIYRKFQMFSTIGASSFGRFYL